MKRTLVALALLALAGTAYAAAPDNGLEKGQVTHLYLYEKDSSWMIVEGGAWGKLSFKEAQGDYVFNGHMLTPQESYTLINYCRAGSEWPPTIKDLESGVADEYGEVHIKGTLPELCSDTTPGSSGTKIWLVPSSAVGEDILIGWNPTTYLFEYNTLEEAPNFE